MPGQLLQATVAMALYDAWDFAGFWQTDENGMSKMAVLRH